MELIVPRKRVAWTVVLCVLVFGAGVILATRAWPVEPVVAASSAQQNVNRAGVVVSFGTDEVEMECVSFSESTITAETLLDRAGYDFALNNDGNICRVEMVGCPANNCYCQCGVAECQFWGYYQMTSTGWQRSFDSLTWLEITNGDVIGLMWAGGNFNVGVPPPKYTFEQVCGGQSSTPTVTPTPTGTIATSGTATLTQPRGPQVTFRADSSLIKAGTCTLLRWQVLNADQVILDQTPVNLEDQKEICPALTQRYVLVANSATGQTVLELTVQVVPVLTPIVGQTPAATPSQPVTGTLPAPTASGVAPIGAVAPPVPPAPPMTPTSTIEVIGLIFGPTPTATPTLKALPPGPTATPLLNPEELTSSVTSATERPATSSPQRLLILAIGLLLGAGGLCALGFWAWRRSARSER